MMEVLKQIVYLVLVMFIIYLVFYLMTYKVDGNRAALNGPDIKTGVEMRNDVPNRFTDITHDRTDQRIVEGSRSVSGAGYVASDDPVTPRFSGAKAGSRTFSRSGQWGKFEGPMISGKPEGYGIFRYQSKDVFLGHYVDGQRHGKGYSIFRSGKVKEREYNNGRLVDELDTSLKFGTKKFKANGVRGSYEGPLKNREPHGLGYTKFDDGTRYIGYYSNGVRHGKGNYIDREGNIILQEFVDGEFRF